MTRFLQTEITYPHKQTHTYIRLRSHHINTQDTHPDKQLIHTTAAVRTGDDSPPHKKECTHRGLCSLTTSDHCPLCSVMSPRSNERVERGAPPFSPVFSRSPRHRATNRYGDFVWSRGETRDQNKAKSSGLLSHVHPPLIRLSESFSTFIR
jgi:hypothetical protein